MVHDLILKVIIHKRSPQLHVYGFWREVLGLFRAVCPGILLDTLPSESEISGEIKKKKNTKLFVEGLKELKWTNVGDNKTVDMSKEQLTEVNNNYRNIIKQEKETYGEEEMLEKRDAAKDEKRDAAKDEKEVFEKKVFKKRINNIIFNLSLIHI